MSKTGRSTTGFREYVLRAAGLLLILLVLAFLWAQSVTNRWRDEAARALKKPTALERYEQLAARKKTKPIAEKKPRPVEAKPISAQPADLKEWDSEDRFARWEHLLAHWKWFMADKSQNGWQALESVVEQKDAHNSRRKLPRELSEEDWASAEGCLARDQGLVREILEVGKLGGPVCVLDFSVTGRQELPHQWCIRQMSEFLVWDAIVKARAGDSKSAVETLVGDMRLGDALLCEPLIYAQYVRRRCYHDVEGALCDGFEAGQLAPDDLRRILDELGRADGRQAFVDALRGEACLRLREFAALRGGDRKTYSLMAIDGMPVAFSRLPGRMLVRVYTGPLGAPWFNADEAALASTMERIASAAKYPYYKAQSYFASIDEELAKGSSTHLFSNIVFKGYKGPLNGQSQFEASLDLARIGLLVEDYRARKGVCPRTLDEIVDGLGGVMPIDPFSGKPYRYASDGDSFLLYSLGPNTTDDGGREARKGGDLVWRAGSF